MRDVVTQVLETVGLVLIVLGGAVWVGGRFGAAAGFAAAGFGCIAASFLLVLAAPKPPRRGTV